MFWNLAIFDFVSTRFGLSQVCFGTLPFLILFPPGLVSHRFVLEPCHLDFVSIRLGSLTVFWLTLPGVFSSSAPLQVSLGDCQLGVHFHRVWSCTGLFWNLAFLLCFHQVGFSYRFVWNLAILILFSPGLSQGWFGTFSRFDFVSKRLGSFTICFWETVYLFLFSHSFVWWPAHCLYFFIHKFGLYFAINSKQIKYTMV